MFPKLADLDDTLYPVSSGLATACKNNIHGDFSVFFCLWVCVFLHYSYQKFVSFSIAGYMAEKLGVEKSKIPELSNLLYKNYGTSMAGLRVCFSFSFSFFHLTLFFKKKNPSHNLKCFFKFSGHWLWLWLWWISQVGFLFYLFSWFRKMLIWPMQLRLIDQSGSLAKFPIKKKLLYFRQ